MASCYHCGIGGSFYRREVITGRSTTSYYGKNSSSRSTRTSHGLRSLCENCAYKLDRSNLIGNIVLFWFINVCLIIAIIYFKF